MNILATKSDKNEKRKLSYNRVNIIFNILSSCNWFLQMTAIDKR